MRIPRSIRMNVTVRRNDRKPSVADGLIAALLLVVPFHAFLTIWLSTAVGHFTLLRLWDEVLLAVLAVIAITWLVRDASLRRRLYASWIARLIGAYAALTVVLGIAALVQHRVTVVALVYALVINLRFLVWFGCVWIAAQRSSWLERHWRALAFGPLVLVVAFGLMQFLLLPHDFLAHFGYGPNTYVPYITINQDDLTIRVQSFLRGANPLGAYMAALVGILAGVVPWSKKAWRWWILLLASLLVLGMSFSRSGWTGALVAILVVGGIRLRTGKQRLIGAGALVLVAAILAGGLLALRNDTAVQDAILHVSSDSTATTTSNEGHLTSLHESLYDIAHEPLGRGPGTSGQASWYNTGNSIRNTESYILQLPEEVGWPGLALFLGVLCLVGHALWRRRGMPLAPGLFASLCGLLLVSLLAYAWTDDTLAYVWWGLAGIALAMPEKQVDDLPPVA